MMSQDLYSVSELNTFIRDVITAGIPRAVWVCGEIQGYDRNKGKAHAFFELVEKSADGHEVKARIGLVIWGNTRPRIEAVLKKAENAFELKDDIEVKFLCRVDFYPGFGQVRLIVEGIDPIHTLGKIAQDRQRLIAELGRSGVLEKNKRREYPLVPLTIGLITAPDSAAYHDFIDELGRSGYGFRVHLAPALMQGRNAAPSVCAAIKALEAVEGIDILVITRGGGSIAELACFDSRDIASAIAACAHPVLTGIGHEINTTITDLAAHTFAKTPTAAAQHLVAGVRDFLARLDGAAVRIRDGAVGLITDRKTVLKDTALALQSGLRRLLYDRRDDQVRSLERLKAASIRRTSDGAVALQRAGSQMSKTIHLRLSASKTKMSGYQKIIEMASPAKVLARGFTVTRAQDGSLLRSCSAASPGMLVRTEFIDGEVASRVELREGS